MIYGFLVKASNEVPIELLETFNIPQLPIIFRGSETMDEVAKYFIKSVVEVSRKIIKD